MTGHDLKVERVTLGLKQIELATQTGIARDRLSRFENGWQNLNPDELTRICEVLNQIRATRQQETDTAAAANGEPPLYAREQD